MKEIRWFVLLVLVLAAESALSAQILGGANPLANATSGLMNLFIGAAPYIAVIGIFAAVLYWVFGEMRLSHFIWCCAGISLMLGARAFVTLVFGVTP